MTFFAHPQEINVKIDWSIDSAVPIAVKRSTSSFYNNNHKKEENNSVIK